MKTNKSLLFAALAALSLVNSAQALDIGKPFRQITAGLMAGTATGIGAVGAPRVAGCVTKEMLSLASGSTHRAIELIAGDHESVKKALELSAGIFAEGIGYVGEFFEWKNRWLLTKVILVTASAYPSWLASDKLISETGIIETRTTDEIKKDTNNNSYSGPSKEHKGIFYIFPKLFATTVMAFFLMINDFYPKNNPTLTSNETKSESETQAPIQQLINETKPESETQAPIQQLIKTTADKISEFFNKPPSTVPAV